LSGTDPHLITIVNMIPSNRSDEDRDDSEPNIAVNPMYPNVIAASAFTFTSNRTVCSSSPCDDLPHPSCKAPIYLSMDGGATWHMEEVLASNNGITNDITLAFGPSGHLYASFLEGCFSPDNNGMKGFMTMRSIFPITDSHSPGTLVMDTVDSRFWRDSRDNRSANIFDQPWITTTTFEGSDRVFIGVNRVGDARSFRFFDGTRGSGRTARVIVSQSGLERSFSGVEIERVRNVDKNLSAIRVAAHPTGKVYAVFYRWISGGGATGGTGHSSPFPMCDIIVVRDDKFGTQTFNQLLEGGPGSSIGKRIGSGLVPLHNSSAADPSLRLLPGSSLGRARLVGSNLSIAVNPTTADHVVAAWCSLDGGIYTLHSRESFDGGNTWTVLFADLMNTTNPALAVASDGKVGMLYQQLTRHDHSPGRSQEWETHFILDENRSRGSSIRNYMLNQFPNDSLPFLDTITARLRPSLGDYVDLQAVNNTFYGVFSAFNSPVHGPASSSTPVYHREYTGRDLVGTSPERRRVGGSVDPFFFKIEPRSAASPVVRR
jgi:hypothetical protein